MLGYFRHIKLSTHQGLFSIMLYSRIKISVNTDISVIGFYRNIGNIGKISVDIFTKISVIKLFLYFNYIDDEK